MAGVTFGGLATGLNTDDIVTKLMAVQRRPIDKMTKDKELRDYPTEGLWSTQHQT